MMQSGSRAVIGFSIALGCIFFGHPETASALETKGRFKQVESDLWRGGLPRKKGLQQLKAMGVRTVIDLMDEDPKKWQEIATSLDNKYVNIPLRRTRPIPSESITKFLEIVQDSANRPVYVHCRSGRDRTGAMVAIYRISASQWTSERAINEMKSLGFNPMFTCLSRSVVDYGEEQLRNPALESDTTDGAAK